MTSREEIIDLALEEQIRANEQYPLFHSPHEAYGVLAEEVDEMFFEANQVKEELKNMWEMVKDDMDIEPKAREIRWKAVCVAQESIQVIAMCNKLLQSDVYKVRT